MRSEQDAGQQTDTPAEVALEAIMAFNRKERYHLIRHAVTGGPWSLTDAFRSELERETGAGRIPDNAYVAMDYHLNWIAAALEIAKMSQLPSDDPSHVRDVEAAAEPNLSFNNKYEDGEGQHKDPRVLVGNQEDTDLLVAFIDGHVLHLILVEAKAGSDWTSDQIRSKGSRLGEIFGQAEPPSWVKPYFVLVGAPLGEGRRNPNFPDLTEDCPAWFFAEPNGHMTSKDFEARIPYLSMQPQRQLFKPTRVSKSGKEWRVEKEASFAPNDSMTDE